LQDTAVPFVREVQQYQRRNFTYEGDTLDAFRGILSFISMQSYWGVPVLNPWSWSKSKGVGPQLRASGFAFGLLWNVAERTGQFTLQSTIHHKSFPSWSWVSQTGVLVDFFKIGFSYSSLAGSELQFESSTAILAAKLGAERLDGTMISVERLFMEHDKEKCVPEETTFLIISSVTARWKFENEDSGGDNFLGKKKQNSLPVSLSHIGDKIIHSMSCGPARISLDQECGHISSPDERIHKRPVARDGFAILRLISRYYVGTVRGYWLAVRPLNDGSFRREGVIINQLDERLFRAVQEDFELSGESLTTIRLG
jgi:hypothetical protein